MSQIFNFFAAAVTILLESTEMFTILRDYLQFLQDYCMTKHFVIRSQT